MNKIYFIQGLKMFLFMLLALFAISYFTMHLWNWLMPEIFGLTTICWMQSAGLIVLSKIIFGFGKSKKCGCSGCNRINDKMGSHFGWKEKMKNRYENMSDEEKEKFKNRCGGWFNQDKDEIC